MSGAWTAAAVVGGSIVGGAIGAKGAKDAASTSAAASRYTADLQAQQYEQSRSDLAPYREVATGNMAEYNQLTQSIESMVDDFMVQERGEIDKYLPNASREDIKAMLMSGNSMGQGWDERWGAKSAEAINTATKLETMTPTGGALNELADYGQSKVAPGDYIPDTNIPTYQGSTIGDMPSIDQRVSDFGYQGDIPEFNVTGDIPEFDSTQFDIYKDPSYEWRKEEMLRGLDRTAGATGKITSGNRMEDIMQRTGEMASQEYGAARGRMVEDYGLRRGAETEQYGRDVYGYGQDRSREQDIYGRAVGEYGLTRSAEDARYGRGTDEYGRVYGRDVDQYGRDLTGYNALVQQEAGQYGRGVDAYGRAYGQEGDYLNRLSSLANIGQTATNTGVQAGTQAAYYGGQDIQAAGQAQAAGQLGQATAWQQGIGDLTSMYTASRYQPTNTYNYSGAGGGIPYDAFVNDANYRPYG